MLTKMLLVLLLISMPVQNYAAGGMTHMFIAKEIITQLPDQELQTLITNNMDAYLVGSNYPDTGYIQGIHYGNESHTESFITAFVNYLQERYSYPEQQNPKLVAFLLGCATHVESDQVFHGIFMHKIALEDFHSNWQKAHAASERQLDMLINIEKNQWSVRPIAWWLPLHDLAAIYTKMGTPHSLSEIFIGNAIYSFTGIGERALSPLSYYYIKSKLAWTAKNYYDSPQGGMLMTEQVTAQYVLKIWDQLKHNTPLPTTKKTSAPVFTFMPTHRPVSGWYGHHHSEIV
jgi:hypothetical protein